MSDVHLSSGVHDRFGQTEIDDFYLYLSRSWVTGLKHDVARLEVTMDQTLSRSCGQRMRDLSRNFHNQLRIQRAVSSHTSFQGFAVDQFHCVKAAAPVRCSTKLINGGHIRMTQCSRGPSFAQKTFARIL